MRDSCIGDVEVRKDAVIGLVDGTWWSREDLLEAFKACERVRQPPAGVRHRAHALNGRARRRPTRSVGARRVPRRRDRVHVGGQPLYPILAAPNDRPHAENTAMVVDSTCDPRAHFFGPEGIFLVPLKVLFGDETYRRPRRPHASTRSSPGSRRRRHPDHIAADYRRFQRCYAERLRALRARLLHPHLGKLSGTVQAAEAAARLPAVAVVDTHTVCTAIALLGGAVPRPPPGRASPHGRAQRLHRPLLRQQPLPHPAVTWSICAAAAASGAAASGGRRARHHPVTRSRTARWRPTPSHAASTRRGRRCSSIWSHSNRRTSCTWACWTPRLDPSARDPGRQIVAAAERPDHHDGPGGHRNGHAHRSEPTRTACRGVSESGFR